MYFAWFLFTLFIVYGHIATEDDIKNMLIDLNLEEDAANIGILWKNVKLLGWDKLLEYFKRQKKDRSEKDEEDTCIFWDNST